MVYPTSPFTNKLDSVSMLQLSHPGNSVGNEVPTFLEKSLKWLCTAPVITSYRINTLKYTVDTVKNILETKLEQLAKKRNTSSYESQVSIHPVLPDCILVKSWSEESVDLIPNDREIIVDGICGAAVLRGAHVFAPGVIGMLADTKHGDSVSVYADISKHCKRGLKRPYECPHKVFVGNGIVRMVRKQIYGDNIKPRGIAIEITDNVSRCPTLPESSLPDGSATLQNIPSIVCGYVLNPQPGEVILDMCASPGNKTTHLGNLMKNQGILIAIDKTPNKVEHLTRRCQQYSLDCVRTFKFDSTKAYDENLATAKDPSTLMKGPPFPKDSFDRILLDAPCSGIGQRPQLLNTITEVELQSYIPLQKKLFRNAIFLLKQGGHLVYSTCTITLAENEGIISWALESFDCLELVEASPTLGGLAWPGTKLTTAQTSLVQRFGPEDSTDSVGFFIAHFVKK